MEKLRKSVLKTKLAELGLPTEGIKVDLIKRLMDAEITVEDIDVHDDPCAGEGDEATEQTTDLRSSEDRLTPQQSATYDLQLSLMRREKELAEREVQLLRREMELMRVSPQFNSLSVTPPRSTLRWNHIADMFGDYDGANNDFVAWEKQIRHLVFTHKLEEDEAKALLCGKLKGKALRWYRARPDCVEMTFETVLEELEKMFCQRSNMLRLRRNFEKRTWQRGESFADYMHEKIILGNLVPIHEKEIVDYVIEGIPDKTLQREARVQRFRTAADLLEGLADETLEEAGTTARRTEESWQRRPRQFSQPLTRQPPVTRQPMTQPLTTQPRRRQNNSEVRCYNCNQYGHFSADCERPRRPRSTAVRPAEREQPTAGHTPTDDNIHHVTGQQESDFHRVFRLRIQTGNLVHNTEMLGLIDTGSPVSFVKSKEIPPQFVSDPPKECISLRGINGSALRVVGIVNARVSCGDDDIDMNLYIVTDDTMSCSGIFGRDFVQAANLKLNKDLEIAAIMNIDMRDNAPTSEELSIGDDMPSDIKERVREIFQSEYIDSPRPEHPKTESVMKIMLNDDKSFHCTPRRLSHAEKTNLKIVLDDWLERDIIRESESEYASPIVLVKKRNGQTRVCIDFRILNKISSRDNFPLPLIEDQLELLEGKKYFTTLDLKDGFFHVKMHPDSVKYTSFVTPLGQYECLRMPFGLKGAPLKFQRYVTEVFRELLDSGDVAIYLDDFLIATRTIEHHLIVLRNVFRILVQNKLELRIDKCAFLQTKLEYLGYTITSEGVRPTKRGLQAVAEFPMPRNVREVQSFLGLCSYFRKFVEGFSLIAKPLHDLVRKDAIFRLGRAEIEAFELLKSKLLNAPILSIYNPRSETELHCDASAIGYGAILLQRKADRNLHPLFYFSKRTTPAEAKYHSFELETLAIIYALRRFRTYLYGVRFKIVTDCQSLALTLDKRDINPRIARWALELQNFDYVIEHRSGNRMLHVDALSRSTNILVIEDNSFERNLALSQSNDSDIDKLRKKLEISEDRFFEMRNGLIYRKRDDRVLFYVPSKMESIVLHAYHNDMGHVGIDKTLENIMRSYWFPRMREKVTEHVSSCLKCIAYSPVSGKTEGFLHNIPKGDKPFITLHIDHLGPITKTSSVKKRYVFLAVDAFTKFLKLYATKTTNTREVIQCLKDYFVTYSRPIRIISDRGSCFTSQDFAAFMTTNGIQHVQVATASPQANGQVERMNRLITPMIAKLADEKKLPWYSVLRDVEYACNNTVSRSTGESPSMLLFGVHQRGDKVDALRDLLELSNPNMPFRDLNVTRERARKRIEDVQAANKENINKKRKPANEYKLGERVMIRNYDNSPGVNAKMIPKFKGPYEIIRVLRNNRYVVADIQGFQMSQIPYQGTWEAANMRRWNDGQRVGMRRNSNKH